jgi:hypothetical protein
MQLPQINFRRFEMGLFDNIKNVVTDAASTAQSATKEFVEVTKLENSIKHQNSEIDELYKKIGEAVFEMYKNDMLPEASLKDYCENIKQHNVMIEEIKAKISEVKEKK